MNTHGVTIRSIKALRGPSIHAYMPVLQIVLDIGRYEELPSTSFDGFPERLEAWLPGIRQHECSVGRPGGFLERLRRGTYLAHIAEHIALELQTLMGFDVAFGRARGAGERGVYNVIVAYQEEQPARAAFEAALRLVLAAMHGEPFDIEGELERLNALADEYRLGPSTASIVNAARRRNIPILRLTETGSLVQLGYGVHQKRILASETSNTSQIAADICQEKPLTNRLLRAVGVPVPDGRAVRSADDAWAAAQEIGLPVVVKPEAGNQGKGVSVNLAGEDEVRAAFELASGHRGDVLVERYVRGADHRLLVVNGALVAAARRDPAQVTGDGQRTIEQLVAEVNRDPRRRPGHGGSLTRIKLDEAVDLVLGQQGLDRQSVPAAGRVVPLRTNCNLSTGGTAVDVTDEVHPANARVAELAAQIVGLDIAGIDLMCEDISRPLDEQGGAIVEVNAAPGLRMHLAPARGKPRPVGEAIVDMLYPAGAPSRIPLIAVTGTNGKTTVTRLISHIFAAAHRTVGMTCTDGVFIGGRRIMSGDCSGPRSAQAVLLHPQVEAAVLETARGGILRAGLAFDRCSVGVVTNLSSDHLGLGGINTLHDLAKVKQVIVESVARDGAAVLNAEDPLVAEMAAATDARVVYFARDAANHVLAAHLAEGGSGVFVDKGQIVLASGAGRVPFIELERLEWTMGGAIGFQVQNALAAAAAAWAAGLNPAIIARALTTFATDEATVPGRFNRQEIGGVEVILDYGHNPAAMCALADAMRALDRRRTVMVIGLPGDRRDQDLRQTIDCTLDFVDEYVLHDLGDRRGRAADEVPRLLRAQLPATKPALILSGQGAAIDAAWEPLCPGDRLIVIADEVDASIAMVQRLAETRREDACLAPIALERGAGGR